MTRDDLLKNLLQIQPCIVRISHLQSQQIKLSAQFQREKAQISTSGSNMVKIVAAALAAAVYGVAIVECLLEGNIETLLVGIVVTAISAIGFKATWGKRTGFKQAAAQEAKSLIRSSIGGDASSQQMIRQARQEGRESFVRWLPYIFALILAVMAFGSIAMILSVFSAGSIVEKLAAAAAFVVIFGAAMVVIQAKNKGIAQQNQNIRAKNDALSQQYWASVTAQESEAQKVRAMGQGWYPESYYTVDAVNFFIAGLKNFRADSMKELVNLYVEEGHRKRMEQSQAQIQRDTKNLLNTERQVLNQMQYANVLNVMQLDMLASIDRSVREAAFQAGQTAVNTYQTRNAVNGLRNDIARRK